jgi:curved DNA-binding protein CbpA
MKNYFQILQLPENATHDEIRQAYRRLAKQYHPDVNKSPDAGEKFCEITEAYEFLMFHWPRNLGRYKNTAGYEQKSREHQQTDIFEQFQREAQERARRQARMRYEKFQKQHEAFQESGINDLALLFTIFMRFFSLVLFVFLFSTPVVLAFVAHWSWIFTVFFMWPFAAGLAWYYHDNRKNYFIPGSFYYSADRIRHLYTDKTSTTNLCYYCNGKLANSRSFKLDLLKLKDVRLKSGGYRQHNVNYVNDTVSILIPRSQKAFIIHSANILLKVFSLTVCLVFLNISSITWRVIIGLVAGGLIARFNMLLFNTRSNTTYLFSMGLIVRATIWITAICMASRFYFDPFNIYTTDAIQFVIVSIIVFDSFLMQLINMVLGKYSFYPVFRQYPPAEEKFHEGFRVYNDVPVISFVYPLFKWIFG